MPLLVFHYDLLLCGWGEPYLLHAPLGWNLHCKHGILFLYDGGMHITKTLHPFMVVCLDPLVLWVESFVISKYVFMYVVWGAQSSSSLHELRNLGMKFTLLVTIKKFLTTSVTYPSPNNICYTFAPFFFVQSDNF